MMQAMIQSLMPGLDFEKVTEDAKKFAEMVAAMHASQQRVEAKQDAILALLQQITATAVDAQQGQDGTLQDATKDDNAHHYPAGNSSPNAT